MASTSLTNQNVECHILTLFEKLDAMRRDANVSATRLPMQAEVRTLEFWRSIISECLATFFYVFIACGGGASLSVPGVPIASPNLGAALATGFAVATLTQCFGHVSGAHMNPAVTVAMATTRNISPLRAAMFVTAQCGGGIAGAALLYGVTLPGYYGGGSGSSSSVAAGGANSAFLLQQLAPPPSPAHLSPWERFGVDFILSFIVVFTYFVCMADCSGGCGGGGGASWGSGGSAWWGGGVSAHRRWLQGQAALPLGAAYLSCSLVALPSLNPARSLGPAFVTNKWENHWVYWFGPLLGGIVSGLIYEFIFNPKRQSRRPKDSIDGDSSSIHSDEDPYDEVVDKGTVAAGTVMSSSSALSKFHQQQQLHQSQGHLHQSNHAQQNQHNSHLANHALGTHMTHSAYQALRPGAGDVTLRAQEPSSPNGNGALTMGSLYPATSNKLDRVESLYGGTKSLYTKSPPLTRANLNRSQSVYSKTPSQGGRGGAGGLPPRPGPLVPAQSLYPMRGGDGMGQNAGNGALLIQPRSESIYGVRSVANIGGGVYGGSSGKSGQGNTVMRPESVYAPSGRRQDSTDSSYGSYQSSGVGAYAKNRGDNQRHMQQSHQHHSPVPHLMGGGNPLSNSPGPNSMLNTPNSVSSFRHLSPSPQY